MSRRQSGNGSMNFIKTEAGPSNGGHRSTSMVGPSSDSQWSQSSFSGPPPPAGAPVFRQASKAYSSAIAARSDDQKYKAKYKELKRKVKEIELENDRVQVNVLKAKKNIQRLRLERAILYERLAALNNEVPLPQQSHPPHQTRSYSQSHSDSPVSSLGEPNHIDHHDSLMGDSSMPHNRPPHLPDLETQRLTPESALRNEPRQPLTSPQRRRKEYEDSLMEELI